jgi:hypothetical protein
MRSCLIVAAVAAVVLSAATAQASDAHWCRKGDPPIFASAQTGCQLAGDTVTDYVIVCHEARSCKLRVPSPAERGRLLIRCHRGGLGRSGMVYCYGALDSGIWTRFSADI